MLDLQHTSPSQASHGVLFVIICEKIDCVITALHCTVIDTPADCRVQARWIEMLYTTPIIVFLSIAVYPVVTPAEQWRHHKPGSRWLAAVVAVTEWGLGQSGWVDNKSPGVGGCGWGDGGFKSTYELLNFNVWIKFTSFNVLVRYFVWNFKGNLWNSTQNILTIHWKRWLYTKLNF